MAVASAQKELKHVDSKYRLAEKEVISLRKALASDEKCAALTIELAESQMALLDMTGEVAQLRSRLDDLREERVGENGEGLLTARNVELGHWAHGDPQGAARLAALERSLAESLKVASHNPCCRHKLHSKTDPDGRPMKN